MSSKLGRDTEDVNGLPPLGSISPPRAVVLASPGPWVAHCLNYLSDGIDDYIGPLLLDDVSAVPTMRCFAFGTSRASCCCSSLKGTQTSDPTSTSEFVRVDEPAQDIAPSNAGAVGGPRSWIGPRVRSLEL